MNDKKTDTTKELIKEHLEDYAKETGRPTGRRLFNCFLEDHDDENASMQFKKTYYKCYGCNRTKDIFDLYAEDHNLDVVTDFAIIKKALAEKYNIDYKAPAGTESKDEAKKPKETKEKLNYSAYYKECKKHIAETDYFKKRGITEEVIKKYNLGYDPKTNYVILPVSKSFYVMRDTIEDGKRLKFNIPKGASVEMFNKELIEQADFKSVVFITESIIDALSLEVVEPNIKAIALNGKGNYLDVVEEAKKSNFKGYFVICLDNDENKQGQKTSNDLQKELEKQGFRSVVLNKLESKAEEVYNGCKDINEYLLKDKESLSNFINQYDTTLKDYLKKEALTLLEKENAYNYLSSFEAITLDEELRNPIKTGINRLDRGINGGFYKKNLIIIGANSGSGKTTLALQIADNIASNGQDALIFSLEMSKEELIAKSLSRVMYEEAKKINRYSKAENCLSHRQILGGVMYDKEESKKLYESALETYKNKIAKHIFINECSDDNEITLEEIESRIKRHIDITETKPFVVIDYLQIIENKQRGLTDIQATSNIVKGLKRLARKYAITILVISAFNRGANYSDTSYTSFRDTSTIEYTADVLLSLQYSVLDTSDDLEEGDRTGAYKIEKKIKQAVKDASKEDIKKLTLKVLKNRNGKPKDLSYIDFYGKNNYFDFKLYDDNDNLIDD